MNELICVLLGHRWKRDFRYTKYLFRTDRDLEHEWEGPIGVEYMICLRCGREEIKGFVFPHYDD